MIQAVNKRLSLLRWVMAWAVVSKEAMVFRDWLQEHKVNLKDLLVEVHNLRVVHCHHHKLNLTSV